MGRSSESSKASGSDGRAGWSVAARAFTAEAGWPIAAGVVVLILVAAAIIIMLVNRKKKKKLADVEHTHALPGQHPPNSLEAGPNMEDQIHLQMAERDALQQQADNAALASIKVPPVKTKKAEVLVKQLRENAKKDPNPSLHVLQTWLHDR